MNRLLYFLVLFTFFGCVNDKNEYNLNGQNDDKGIYISFAPQDNVVVSKALGESGNEDLILDIYLFVFNGSGSLLYSNYYDISGSSNSITNSNLGGNRFLRGTKGAGVASGQVVLEAEPILNGENRSFVAIANVGSENSVNNSMMNISVDSLAKIQNISQLENMILSLKGDLLGRDGLFLMSGREDNVTITPDTRNDVEIQLFRVDSKVKFVIKTASGTLFTPSKWRVVSAPKKTYLFSSSSNSSSSNSSILNGSTSNSSTSNSSISNGSLRNYGNAGNGFADSDYFSSDYLNYDYTNGLDSATFSFYILETILQPKMLIPYTESNSSQQSSSYYANQAMPYSAQQNAPYHAYQNGNLDTTSYTECYALREKRSNNDFIYAPNNATYVEILGNLTYQNQSGREVSADVKYIVHLGAINNNPNDYNSIRNTSYIYNITILSVNDIIVEAESLTGEEPRPGSSGSVSVSREIKSVDAANEVFILKFTPDDIDNTTTWSVSTPFSEGEAKDNPADYKWIHFKLCSLSGGIYKAEFVTYPGDDQVYTDYELYMNADGTADLARIEQSNYKHPLDKFIEDFTGRKDKMLDIRQLLLLLKESKARVAGSNIFDSNNEAVFTVFVNENYYYSNPNSSSSTNDFTLWKQFVNQDRRVMNIVSTVKVSADGECSKYDVICSIRQESIQTMYNKYSTDNFTAWGSQVIQDDDLVPFSNESFTIFSSMPVYRETYNGRKNFINMITNSGQSNWGDFIDQKSLAMRSDYNVAKYRCMRLNRDMNGNGVIDENEIQWYLASIDQLTDMWIGENSYDAKAKLYKYDTWQENKQWYVSSTVPDYYRVRRYKENPLILWSAEGSSIGSYFSSSTSTQSDILVRYRCVRNLGIENNADINLFPDRFATLNGNVVNLDRLDHSSIRSSFFVDELPDHNERDKSGYNSPYKMFEFTSEIYGSKLTWNDVHDRSQPNSSNKICPDGWRVPNQRELALIYSLLDKTAANWPATNHLCRTSFSFGTSLRPGFSVLYAGEVYYLLNDQSKDVGGVRCVRDINP